MTPARACLLKIGGGAGIVCLMSREALLTDAQWARIEPLMPSSEGQRGRPFREHRQVL